MSLTIRTTNAMIGIKRTPPTQDIKQPKADFELDVTQAQVTVELKLPKITIDQSAAFSESGLKNTFELTKEVAEYSKAKMYESIARIAEQGDQLAKYHENPSAIADHARYNAYDQFDTEYNMVTMPRTRPKVDVIEGFLDIKVKEGTATNESSVNKPEINNDPGKVEVYLRQKNSISIQYTGSNFDMKL